MLEFPKAFQFRQHVGVENIQQSSQGEQVHDAQVGNECVASVCTAQQAATQLHQAAVQVAQTGDHLGTVQLLELEGVEATVCGGGLGSYCAECL